MYVCPCVKKGHGNLLKVIPRDMADMCHKMESGTAIPEDNVTLCIYHYTLYHLPNRISKRHVETLIPWVA